MNWIEVKNQNCLDFKQGTICRLKGGSFVLVGEINTCAGVNDEFTEHVTHYSEELCEEISKVLIQAEINFGIRDE